MSTYVMALTELQLRSLVACEQSEEVDFSD
jgi:hypothetical protein